MLIQLLHILLKIWQYIGKFISMLRTLQNSDLRYFVICCKMHINPDYVWSSLCFVQYFVWQLLKHCQIMKFTWNFDISLLCDKNILLPKHML
jgi:hypothetical protein